MANEGFHEASEKLSSVAMDLHRALQSLTEELQAVDWYNQRAEACSNAQLKAILIHNRDEEKEHASMLLEWIRRHDPAMESHLREVLFKNGPITGEH